MDMLKTQTTDSDRNISFLLIERILSTKKNSFFSKVKLKEEIVKSV